MTSTTEVLAGRYRLGRLLGRGGMSDVYLAVDQDTDREVAVKIVRSGDPDLARRLAQEARALEGFAHPGLVRLLDTGVSGDQAFLVMDYVDGLNLAEILRRGPLEPRSTAALGASVAGALAYVHERGIVHRDIKPANILLNRDGDARLGDFGIARLIDVSTLTLDGTTLGTAAYMAPEQLQDHQVGPPADIWSLGLVLLECMTGERVYQGSPGEMVARRLAGPVPIPADLPVPWKVLLSGMLHDRPDQRLDASEVAALLTTAAFAAAWVPGTAAATALAATQLDDLTLVTPPAAAAAAAGNGGGAGTTVVSPAAGVGGTTQAIPADTRVAPPSLLVAAPSTPRVSRRRLGIAGAVLAAALVVALVLALGSNGGSPTATTRATTTTTSPTTTTSAPTTTTVPTAAQSLAALVGAVASGVAAGTVPADVGQTIVTQAEQAVTNAAAGKPDQAANNLQQAATSIAHGVQSGDIAASGGTQLQAALSALASALGLGAAATAPTTTAPTTAPTAAPPPTQPGPGNKPKAGKGN
ncbi:MAG TPA: serine/threonine-protein kinase [Acidimicrobiales bacterium]|nr:serine/threonine-protein kinase [Acidimicrobiales bacterium]